MQRFFAPVGLFVACAICSSCATPDRARGQDSTVVGVVPTPESVIGHRVGADYKLARWESIVDYFDRLGRASDRIHVRRLDVSTEGNPYVLCEISSAATIRSLDTYRGIQAKLADPRLILDESERAEVLGEAKTTIVVTCGLHSNEVAASQMSMELAYELASRNDDRTREILDHCIILLVPSANPDGNNKIVDWYEKTLGTPFEGGRMPWLYQKYAGHDNNRDWFMLNLKESRILTRVLYEEWHPTILYDIHQMGNRGARFFVPPFFDPVNPNVDPLIHQSLLIIGGHMATELQERGKTGVVFKAIYDNWWQGGNRTTPYRHNIVGILTEAASAKYASPVFQDYRDLSGHRRGLSQYAPAVNFPEPWAGGWWRLRDIVDYERIACEALFTLSSRYRDRFVRNHLTLSEKALRLGREEPPFAWLVPPDQGDPGAAEHMLRVFALSGIEVHRAAAAFEADSVSYDSGTFILYASQPYRSHLKDMMERQEYPDRRVYEGGPAEAPYDAAGWTLPLQMGVRSVEVISPFEVDSRRVDEPRVERKAPKLTTATQGFVTKRQGNSDYSVINSLLSEGFELWTVTGSGAGWPLGSVVVTATSDLERLSVRMSEMLRETPARFEAVNKLPDRQSLTRLRPPRTGMYQPWTASMDEGWTRFVLEQHGFPFATVHNAEIRAGNLWNRYDCLIIPDLSLRSLLDGMSDKDIPPPYAGGIGQDGAMAVERFVRAGGTLVLMDSATALATEVFGVPVRNVVKDVSRDAFYCPGSLLRLVVDASHPLGYGMDDEAAAYFARSQAFVIGMEALKIARTAKPSTKGDLEVPPVPGQEEMASRVKEYPVRSVAKYADSLVLLSGWLLGDEWVRGKHAVCEVEFGAGRIVLLGFRVQHRGQPHSTFKFLFNSIYRSVLSPGDGR